MKHAIVKFNGGRGALLCNKCNAVIRTCFELEQIEDREHFCRKHEMKLPEYCATHSLKEFLQLMKDAEPVMDVLDGPDQECHECTCTDPVHGGKLWKCVPNPNLCPIQNNCKYGYVLPDRCRYTRHLGCDCGAYPPC